MFARRARIARPQSIYPSAMVIRRARVDDRDALYEICLRTADAGADGTHLYHDPELPGQMWVGAYLALQPDLAFVYEDAAGVAGYVIGAYDTVEFENLCERHWWPPLQRQYPNPVDVLRLERSRDQQLHRAIHRPMRTPVEPIATFPSHLHIDLLPRAQGTGRGREMMDAMFGALRAKGSLGVHLGVSPRNTRAVRFYDHLGFSTLADYGEHGLLLGLVL